MYKKTNGKNCKKAPAAYSRTIIAMAAAVTILCSGILQGCSGQEMTAYFNKGKEIAVDNISDTQGTVDNTFDSQRAVDNTSEKQSPGNAPNNFSAENLVDDTGRAETENSREHTVSSDAEHTASSDAEHAGAVETEQEDAELIYTGPEVTLVMVGDILLHTPVAESGLQEDGSYNFAAIFANVKDEISAADLALVNQEVIIGGKDLGISGYPSFNAPYELGDALVNAGFDVILHATNHTLDQGKKGVKNCLSFWKNNYPETAVLGINESQEAQNNNIYIYEQEGIRIAILNYTYGTNGIALPSDMPYAVNLLEEEKVAADIVKARAQADFVVVCPHWGTEYQLTPSVEQTQWTEFFAENGVDLVLGTHPHVIEPVEWITNEMGENETLVYYSLGNFVNWTASSGEGIANRMVGGMAQVTIGKDENGQAFIVEYGVEPLVCHLSEGANGVTVYQLSDYTDELASENEIIKQDSAFSLEYCENLCEEVWGEIW